MNILAILFWISLAILFYCYIGYGLLLALVNPIINSIRRKKPVAKEFQAVTLIIPAYNESRSLLEKIRNTLELDYPKEMLAVIFVTDGSDDGSAEMIQQSPGFIHLHDPVRKGKFA